MKVLFIWPGIYMGWNIIDKGFEQSAINHGLCAISAVLKSKDNICPMIDLRACAGWEHFESALKSQSDFDAAVMGFYSVDIQYATRAIQILKRNFPNRPVIVGGVHVTYGEFDFFSEADCVVWGEGDHITSDLLQILEAGRSIPSKLIAPMIDDLDSLPFIDRSLFNTECEQAHPLFPLLPVPYHTVNFSRGCPWKCTFCLESKNNLWKRYRMRSPESCVEEIKRLDKIYGLGSLMIHDDHLPTGKWIYKFIELWDREIGKKVPFWCQIRADWICKYKDVIPEIKKMGLTWVSLGIEGSQRMLDFYDKRLSTEQVIRAASILHRNGVNIFGNYILGAPTETDEDIAELESIVARIRPQIHSPSIYTSYPGSLLFDYVSDNDLWLEPIEDGNNHYSMARFPFERKIKKIDYKKIFKLRDEWPRKYKGELKQ